MFPPNTLQTVKRFGHAMDFAPPPGFPSRWAPNTGPRRTSKRNFHKPIHYSPAVHRARVARLTGLGDGDAVGGMDTWFDDLSAAAGGTVSAALAPATAQIDQLKLALKTILVLSGIAAGASVLGLLRR